MAKKKILIVEDEESLLKLESILLTSKGYDVRGVANGQEALDAVAAADTDEAPDGPFDVILMDMQMPVLDGYAATKRLRQQGYEGPIIALTAHAMNSDRSKCIDAGCDDYMTKPIDKRELLAKVAKHLVPSESPSNAS